MVCDNPSSEIKCSKAVLLLHQRLCFHMKPDSRQFQEVFAAMLGTQIEISLSVIE